MRLYILAGTGGDLRANAASTTFQFAAFIDDEEDGENIGGFTAQWTLPLKSGERVYVATVRHDESRPPFASAVRAASARCYRRVSCLKSLSRSVEAAGATNPIVLDRYGPLVPDPHRILDLPGGFGYRVISRTGDRMADGLLVPGFPDGMAAFSGSDGKVAHDEARMKRFEREAHVLASLNHPNIVAIYGLEDVDGVRALVLELVEGPTLAERIALGPMTAEEVVRIARQMAVGLEAAHEKSVIHRDLKPACHHSRWLSHRICGDR